MAELIGAQGRDVVPVTNATAAANIVISGLGLRRGDLLLMTNLTYPAVRPHIHLQDLSCSLHNFRKQLPLSASSRHILVVGTLIAFQ